MLDTNLVILPRLNQNCSVDNSFLTLSCYDPAAIEVLSALCNKHRAKWGIKHLIKLEQGTVSYREHMVPFGHVDHSREEGLYLLTTPDVVLLEHGQTVVIDTSQAPAVILAAKDGNGPVVVIRITLQSLVGQDGDSLISRYLQLYENVWGGLMNVVAYFTTGSHHAPVDLFLFNTVIAQAYDHEYEKVPAGQKNPRLFSSEGLNLAIILVSQLAWFGIEAQEFFHLRFNCRGGLTFITKKVPDA